MTAMTAARFFTGWNTSHAQTTAIVLLATILGGCVTKTDPRTTGSIPVSSAPLEQMTATQLENAEKSVGAAYERNPKDRNTGLRYAKILRMTGKNVQALAVMRQVAIAHPTDRDVLAAYGKAQAAAGQLEAALATIQRAQTPDRPDWRLYSAEGAVPDQPEIGRANV